MMVRFALLSMILAVSACGKSAPPAPAAAVNLSLARFRLSILDTRQNPPRLFKTEEMSLPLVEGEPKGVVNISGHKTIWRIDCSVLYLPDMPGAPGGFRTDRSPGRGACAPMEGPWPYEVAQTTDSQYHLLKGGMSIGNFDAPNDGAALQAALKSLEPELSDRGYKWRAGAKKWLGAHAAPL